MTMLLGGRGTGHGIRCMVLVIKIIMGLVIFSPPSFELPYPEDRFTIVHGQKGVQRFGAKGSVLVNRI